MAFARDKWPLEPHQICKYSGYFQVAISSRARRLIPSPIDKTQYNYTIIPGGFHVSGEFEANHEYIIIDSGTSLMYLLPALLKPILKAYKPPCAIHRISWFMEELLQRYRSRSLDPTRRQELHHQLHGFTFPKIVRLRPGLQGLLYWRSGWTEGAIRLG